MKYKFILFSPWLLKSPVNVLVTADGQNPALPIIRNIP